MSNRRDRKREIADVLSRHGLDYVVGLVGLDRWVPFHHGLLGHERREAPYTRPDHLRLALEQLGPTFVKLGQILSTRPDLVPPEYQAELAKLQDAAPPVRADAVRDVVAHEFGSDAPDMFATFDFEPLAAASIGQAHAATLRDGTEVVVKVRRPLTEIPERACGDRYPHLGLAATSCLVRNAAAPGTSAIGLPVCAPWARRTVARALRGDGSERTARRTAA